MNSRASSSEVVARALPTRATPTIVSEADHGFVRAEWSESPPSAEFHDFRSDAGFLIEVWGEWVDGRQQVGGARVRWQHDPPNGPYLEWTPGRGRVAMVGECKNKQQERRLWRGEQAIRDITLYGPRTHPRSRSEFLELVHGALLALPSTDQSFTGVLVELRHRGTHLKRTQFYAELERFGLPGFPTLKRWLLKEATDSRGRVVRLRLPNKS